MTEAKSGAIPSAEQLRLQMLEKEMAEMEKREKATRQALQGA